MQRQARPDVPGWKRPRQATGTGTSTSSSSSVKNTAQNYREYGCFLPDGDVLCFCNTEPRIRAIRRVTRKESSPNLGREFWSCGNWVEGAQCGFFLWCDQAASKGREYRTPPPPGAPAPAPLTPSSSPQKRPRAPSPAIPRPSPSSRVPLPPSESLDDIDPAAFDDPGFDDQDDDDEIEDADEGGPPSASALRAAASSSPSKKPRFESFTAGSSGSGGGEGASSSGSQQLPSTPKTRPGGFEAIRSDPDSPFHALQKSLFGGGQGDGHADGLRGGSTPAPGDNAAEPDALGQLTTGIAALPSLLGALRKERERDQRLLVAAKRREDVLKRAADKAKEESEGLRRVSERLKERIRMLEEEASELRTRGA
ncbi:uncharacterized protein JCM10292_007036 [Rhodotorula paludigena]|uniref:uncharacterized protein n=1 Tax=Rhodotorula paludigena TaxID=86838 RepID=UPI00317CF2F5